MLISWLKNKFYSTPFLLDTTLISWLSVSFHGTPFSVLVSWLKDRHHSIDSRTGCTLFFVEKTDDTSLKMLSILWKRLKPIMVQYFLFWNHVLIIWLKNKTDTMTSYSFARYMICHKNLYMFLYFSPEMEVTEIILAKVSRLCQLLSHRGGFLSRL